MTTVVTVEGALRGLAAAVAQHGPSRRYATRDEAPNTTCFYSKPQGETPGDWHDGCIVGQALVTIGAVTPEDLEDMDGDGWVPGESDNPTSTTMLTSMAGAVLWEAQHKQDTGYTWWEAMREAQREALAHLPIRNRVSNR